VTHLPRRSMPPLALTLALLFLAAAAGGCEHAPSAQPAAATAAALPTVPVRIGNRAYTLEVAADEPTRRRGLMDRPSLPRDRGMVFVFPDDAVRGFWMKNTLIPLDILFVDRSGRVVSTHTMQPHSEQSTFSGGPARFAIELNAGEVAANGVKPGYMLDLPAAARVARE